MERSRLKAGGVQSEVTQANWRGRFRVAPRHLFFQAPRRHTSILLQIGLITSNIALDQLECAQSARS
jgi:hypothetical protein